MSDRIAVINHGQLKQLDEPRTIYDFPANTFVADFIGESTFVPVTVSGGKVTYDGTTLQTATKPNGATKYNLMMRPERISFVSGRKPKDMNVFKGTVNELVFQGESFLMYAALSDGTLVSVRGATQKGAMANVPDVGAAVSLGLHKDDTVLIPDTGD